MRFINYAIVRFSGFFALGILSAHLFPISFLIFPILATSLIVTALLWLLSTKEIIQTIYFGIAVYISFFLLGFFNYQCRLPKFQKDHYTHFSTRENSDIIRLKIIENIKPDPYNDKYFAKVLSVNENRTQGKVLVNIRKDSISTIFQSDDILLVYSKFSRIPRSLNPHQFEYSEYLKIEGVSKQLFLSSNEILTTASGRISMYGRAQNFRSSLVKKLRKTNITHDELAIIQALVLGERKDISKELYQQYADAGAVHILAVSGLHVGILYVLLTFIFKPLVRIKNGKIIRSLLIVLFLWGFAFLAGLSPSVMRAVSMFTFFAIALIFKRRTSTINTLFLSFLTLLIINPLSLFKIGFQLSYCAVFFILWLHPIFKPFLYSKFYVFREFKSIVAVTFSAQIGVLPLSLFYFHQFPGLFILTNVVVLPTLTIFMSLGILVVILAYFEIAPIWLNEIFNFMIGKLNGFIGWVAGQDQFLLKDVHFSLLKVVATFLLILSLGLFFRKPIRLRTISSGIIFSLLIGVFIWEEKQNSFSEVIVFHRNREHIIGYKQNKTFTLYLSDTTTNYRQIPFITPYIAAKNIHTVHLKNHQNVWNVREKRIIVIDSTGVIPHQLKEADILILKHSPRINLDRILEKIKVNTIIADGSNYPSYVSRWHKSAEKKKLPFHYTAKEGAIIIE